MTTQSVATVARETRCVPVAPLLLVRENLFPVSSHFYFDDKAILFAPVNGFRLDREREEEEKEIEDRSSSSNESKMAAALWPLSFSLSVRPETGGN